MPKVGWTASITSGILCTLRKLLACPPLCPGAIPRMQAKLPVFAHHIQNNLLRKAHCQEPRVLKV